MPTLRSEAYDSVIVVPARAIQRGRGDLDGTPAAQGQAPVRVGGGFAVARIARRCAPAPEGCGLMKPPSEIRWRTVTHGGVCKDVPNRICKSCELRHRYEAKIADPVGVMLQRRAGDKAADLRKRGHPWVTTHHVLCGDPHCDRCQGRNFGWSRLRPVIEALIGEGCLSCGSAISPNAYEDGDLSRCTFDHKVPIKNASEHELWKEHARNIDIIDTSCNRTKHQSDPETWLARAWSDQVSEYESRNPVCACPGGGVHFLDCDAEVMA